MVDVFQKSDLLKKCADIIKELDVSDPLEAELYGKMYLYVLKNRKELEEMVERIKNTRPKLHLAGR